MKTILHIITSLADGGAQAALYRLCTADRGHHHHVISLMGPARYGPMLEAAGIRVTALESPRGWITVPALRRLYRAIRDLRPDAVQTWMYHADLLGGVAARLAGVRHVLWGIHHSTLDAQHSRRSTRLVARICALLSRLVPARIICCAERARDSHAALGYDAARMRVVPNGYDLSRFAPDPGAAARLRAELGLAGDRPVIGFVARFDPAKDHLCLLTALAILGRGAQPPLCLLVGAGMEGSNRQLAQWIARTGTQAHLRLLGPRGDIAAVMNALDLHVMSSASEGFPNVLAEAMACGTPCVSTDVGDAAAIIGATGLIVPPGDPAALADAIAAMLRARQGAEWAKRRAAARARIAQHFSLARMVEGYGKAWSDPRPGAQHR